MCTHLRQDIAQSDANVSSHVSVDELEQLETLSRLRRALESDTHAPIIKPGGGGARPGHKGAQSLGRLNLSYNAMWAVREKNGMRPSGRVSG